MGMYIYGLRGPKHTARVRLDNGQVLTVATYAYSHKPISSFFRDEPRWQRLANARLVRMANVWQRWIAGGGVWPDGGVLVHDDGKISVDSPVMKWSFPGGRLPDSIEDISFNGAKEAGRVVEVLSK